MQAGICFAGVADAGMGAAHGFRCNLLACKLLYAMTLAMLCFFQLHLTFADSWLVHGYPHTHLCCPHG